MRAFGDRHLCPGYRGDGTARMLMIGRRDQDGVDFFIARSRGNRIARVRCRLAEFFSVRVIDILLASVTRSSLSRSGDDAIVAAATPVIGRLPHVGPREMRPTPMAPMVMRFGGRGAPKTSWNDGGEAGARAGPAEVLRNYGVADHGNSFAT